MKKTAMAEIAERKGASARLLIALLSGGAPSDSWVSSAGLLVIVRVVIVLSSEPEEEECDDVEESWICLLLTKQISNSVSPIQAIIPKRQ